MKKLLDISSEERNRILEMHQSATRKNYLTEAPEQATRTPLGSAKIGNPGYPNYTPSFTISDLYAPGETITAGDNYLYIPQLIELLQNNKDGASAGTAKILSHTVEMAPYGTQLGIDPSSIVIKKPVGQLYWGYSDGKALGPVMTVKKAGMVVAPVTVSFKAPMTPFISTAETAKKPVFNVTFDTNDTNQPKQTLPVYFREKSGVAVGAESTPR
jgi:hypothetical protein